MKPRTLAELIATFMQLDTGLRGVTLIYWHPELQPQGYVGSDSDKEACKRKAGKWEINDFSYHASVLADTPEGAVQAAIDFIVEKRRAWAERALKEAGEAALAVRTAEAIARGAP